LIATQDGNYIFIASTRSVDGDVTKNKGGFDAWVVKFDDNFKIIWEKTFGGSGDDFAGTITEAKNGDLIVSGRSNSIDGDVAENKGDFDLWCIRLGPNGKLLWSSTFGGSDYESASSVIETNDNGIIIAGSTKSRDQDISHLYDRDDAWIVKLDAQGNLEWQNTFGGSMHDHAFSILQTEDLGYLFFGSSSSYDGDVTANINWFDAWLVKLSPENIEMADSSDTTFSIVIPGVEANIVDMGKVLVGDTKDSTIYTFITNKIDYNCRIDSIKIQTSDEDNFEAISTLPTTIGPKEKYWTRFKFTPNRIGPFESLIYIYFQSDTLTCKIIGEGIERTLSIEPKAIDFGEVVLRHHKDTTIAAIKNVLEIDVDITKIEILGPDTEQFKILSGGDPFTLAADSSKDISLRFDVKKIGKTRSQLAYYYDGFGSPAIVDLYGTGIHSNESFEILIDTLDFGDVKMFDPKDSIGGFFLNISGVDFDISDYKLIGGDNDQFIILDTELKKSIPDQEICTAKIRFLPVSPGYKETKITFYFQGKYSPITAVIIGNGIPGSNPYLRTYSLDFGLVHINYPKDTTAVLIKNLLDEEIEIYEPKFIGADKDKFNLVADEYFYTLQAHQTQAFKIKYSPTDIGRDSCFLAFKYDGIGSPAYANIYGTGYRSCVSVSSDSAYSGEKRKINLYLGGINVVDFATMVDSYSGILRVEKTLLAPTDATQLYKITNDSTYIEFSGNLDPSNTSIAEIDMTAGLGRVPYTSIDIEEIHWYYQGKEVIHEAEYESGTFTLLGICEEGGQRLINPNGEISLEVMPNPTGDEIKVLLNLIEEGPTELVITNSSGEEVHRQQVSTSQLQNQEIKIDLSDKEQGAYFISLQTPTTKIDKSFVRVR
jgi:hypothetical protein